MPWAYFKVATFPCPTRNTRGFSPLIFAVRIWQSSQALEVKHRSVGSPPRVFISQTCPHLTSSNLSFTHQVSYPRWDALYLPVCVSDFVSNSLPCDLSCLMDLRRVDDVQFVPVVSCCVDDTTSQLFVCCTRNWTSILHLFIHFFYYPSHQNVSSIRARISVWFVHYNITRASNSACLTHSRHSGNISLKKLNKWKKKTPPSSF